MFDQACINSWLKNKSTCPLWKAKVEFKNDWIEIKIDFNFDHDKQCNDLKSLISKFKSELSRDISKSKNNDQNLWKDFKSCKRNLCIDYKSTQDHYK